MSKKFETGQLVKLKSNGPEMTVRTFSVHQEAYQCQWFAGKKLEQGYFPEDSLEPIASPPKE